MNQQVYLSDTEMRCAIDALRAILYEQPEDGKCPSCLKALERLEKKVKK